MPHERPQLSHPDRIRLEHMLDAANRALTFCRGKLRDDLDHDDMLLFAVLKAIEIVGEAAGKVSPSTQAAWPDIDLWVIRRTRNRLIHGYDSIDRSIVWDTVQQSLPRLVGQLQSVLDSPDGPKDPAAPPRDPAHE